MKQENEQRYVERIVKNYQSSEMTKVDELKNLDKKVKRPSKIFAYVFGIIGALILGIGMCLAMKVIGNQMALGICIGVVGIAMVSVNYKLYKIILNSRKKKFSQEIMDLGNEIIMK